MYKKIFIAILFLAGITINIPTIHADGSNKYDGEYTGTMQSELTGVSNQSDVTTKVINSQFIIDNSWESGEYESIGLIGKVYTTTNGQIDYTGQITGTIHTKVNFSFRGFEFNIYEYDAPITGKIDQGMMSWTSIFSNDTKCLFGGTCHVENNFSSNLTKTMTSDSDFYDQPDQDDFTQRIDQSLPILEKVIGEVTTSDSQKKTGFWDSLQNHLDYSTGNVDINGHRVDYDRVWEEGKSGSTLKVGDEIKTGNGRVVLKFADGTKFILMENTLLRKTADGFKIEHGVVASTFWKTGNKVRLITKEANFVVKGTKFAIAAGEKNSVIEVYEGVVETSSNGQVLDVTKDTSVSIDDSYIYPTESIDSANNLQQWNNIESDIKTNFHNISSSTYLLWIAIIVIILFVLFVIFIVILILFFIIRSFRRK